MNELFELLHGTHTAFAVFAIDVAVFVAVALSIYAISFLIKYKVDRFLKNNNLGGPAPRYLNGKKK